MFSLSFWREVSTKLICKKSDRHKIIRQIKFPFRNNSTLKFLLLLSSNFSNEKDKFLKFFDNFFLQNVYFELSWRGLEKTIIDCTFSFKLTKQNKKKKNIVQGFKEKRKKTWKFSISALEICNFPIFQSLKQQKKRVERWKFLRLQSKVFRCIDLKSRVWQRWVRCDYNLFLVIGKRTPNNDLNGIWRDNLPVKLASALEDLKDLLEIGAWWLQRRQSLARSLSFFVEIYLPVKLLGHLFVVFCHCFWKELRLHVLAALSPSGFLEISFSA